MKLTITCGIRKNRGKKLFSGYFLEMVMISKFLFKISAFGINDIMNSHLQEHYEFFRILVEVLVTCTTYVLVADSWISPTKAFQTSKLT